jgi:trk system potassium uptake protein TrkA
MRVLVVGAGEVGFHLAERLSEEGQDVVLIESNPDRADYASQQLDVLTIQGNGASLSTLEHAAIRSAGMLLAVTSRDEVNLIACLAAKRMGVQYTVARVSNPDYYERGSVLSRDELGIDLMVNPERECARETFQLLQNMAFTELAEFARGRVQLIGLNVKPGAPVAGKSIRELRGEFEGGYHYVTVAVVRDGITRIPRAESTIEADDHIYLLAPTDELGDVPPLAGHERFELERAMIAGGSAEGLYLAELLEDANIECTILDRDRRRCQELAESLPRSLVLHADATDLELLEMEGVSGLDGYVTATGNDETNLLSSLLAKTAGAKKVVSLVHKFEYLKLVPRVGVDAAVSPRISTVNAILRYVRRGRVMTVARLSGITAEAIEFEVDHHSRIAGQALRDVEFPKDGVVGTILRGDEIILPRGEDVLHPGDDVIVFAMPDAIPAVEALFD